MAEPGHGTHEYADDPRNQQILIYVNGDLKPRSEAVVSVFDAGFVLGDGVWEGLRVHHGHPAFFDQHLDRLFEGAKALALDIGRSRAQVAAAVYETLRANAMTDGVSPDRCSGPPTARTRPRLVTTRRGHRR
ncbi:MAG: aminotransferase class IV [Nocardioidaceae bacterium]